MLNFLLQFAPPLPAREGVDFPPCHSHGPFPELNSTPPPCFILPTLVWFDLLYFRFSSYVKKTKLFLEEKLQEKFVGLFKDRDKRGLLEHMV
jgi:hypothetical protein